MFDNGGETALFLENHILGWTGEIASTIGKRFVDDMSKALF
jgi:hypothetical protein